MTNEPIPARAWAELILLALFWGASFLAIRTSLDEISPLASATHRVVWAALILWIIILFQRPSVPRTFGIWCSFLVMGCLNNVIPFSLMAWGQLHIETGLTAILNGATAIWGVVLASLIFADERLTLRRFTGVLLGFFGIATAIGLGSLLNFDIRSMAQLAVLAGTLSYALAGSWARARLSGISPIVAAAGMLTCASAIMVPLTLTVEGEIPLRMSLRTWGAIAYFAAVSTALAYILYYRILSRAGAGNLLLVTLMIPPVAIILGAVVRGEALHTMAYVGFAMLALGLTLLDGRLFRRHDAN